MTFHHPMMLQEFLPQIEKGEKRIFLVDGKPMGALLKHPPPGGFLTAADRGGSFSKATLSVLFLVRIISQKITNSHGSGSF